MPSAHLLLRFFAVNLNSSFEQTLFDRWLPAIWRAGGSRATLARVCASSCAMLTCVRTTCHGCQPPSVIQSKWRHYTQIAQSQTQQTRVITDRTDCPAPKQTKKQIGRFAFFVQRVWQTHPRQFARGFSCGATARHARAGYLAVNGAISRCECCRMFAAPTFHSAVPSARSSGQIDARPEALRARTGGLRCRPATNICGRRTQSRVKIRVFMCSIFSHF